MSTDTQKRANSVLQSAAHIAGGRVISHAHAVNAQACRADNTQMCAVTVTMDAGASICFLFTPELANQLAHQILALSWGGRQRKPESGDQGASMVDDLAQFLPGSGRQVS